MPFRLTPILSRPITWDYLPVVSSIKNLVDLFYKFHYRNAVPSKGLNDYHFSHVKDKSVLRCLFLVIPGACFLVGLYDLYRVGPSYASNYVKLVNGTVQFKDLGDELKNNPKIAMEAVELDARNIEFVGAELKQDLTQMKPIALKALDKAKNQGLFDVLLLQHCGVARDDGEVAIKALRRNTAEADYLGTELIRVKNGLIAAAMVESGNMHPDNVDNNVKNDKAQMYFVALVALRRNPENFQYLGASCNDPRIVRMVIEEYRKRHSQYGIYKYNMTEAMEQILQAVGDELKQDLKQMKPFAMEAVGYNGRLLQYVGAAQNDPEVVLKAARNFSNHPYNEFERDFLPYIGAELKKDMAKMHPIAMELVKHAGLLLKDLPSSQNDFDVVKTAVDQNPYAIKYVGDVLKRDKTTMRELVLIAVKKYGSVLEKCKEFQEDFDVVFEAVKQDPRAIEFAGPNLMKDQVEGKKLALLAISSPLDAREHNHWYLLGYCGPWQNDEEVVMTALNGCLHAFRYVGAQLLAKPEFIAKVKPRVLQAVKEGYKSWESDSWNWNIFHDIYQGTDNDWHSVLPPVLQNDQDVKAAYEEFYDKRAKPYALTQLRTHLEDLRSLCMVFNHRGVVKIFEKLQADPDIIQAEKEYQEEEARRKAQQARTA